MAHGFSAVREQRLDAMAERVAGHGVGVLLFDYRSFGASGGEPRQILDIKAQLADWRTAIAWARGHYARVGLFGSSFGGGYALELARTEPAIAAAVAQCPFTDGIKDALKIPPPTALKLMGVALQDELGSRLGRKPRYVPAVGRPGDVAIMTAPDALPGFEALTPEHSNWHNRVAARVGLQTLTFRPGAKAAEITCPLLVCVCERDSVVSASAAAKVAQTAPQGELMSLPIGHFDVYHGEWFERVASRTGEFLARHLNAD
jgi:pimeloyl-ACP methyl ester carboxylesterase